MTVLLNQTTKEVKMSHRKRQLYKTYKTTWNANGIRWETQNKYQNIDTGEIIAKQDALNKSKFVKIKTQKNGTIYNEPRTAATIFLTTFVRSRQLQELPFN